MRGHDVILVDEGREIGGTASLAAVPRFLEGDKLRVARLLSGIKATGETRS